MSDLELAQAASGEEDQVVLSRKASRKAKKSTENSKPLPSSANSDQKSKAPPTRSQYGIWIGNLNFSTSESRLRDFLSTELLSHSGNITRIYMSRGMKPKENNRGHANIDFDNQEMADAAVALSEQHLDGRKLLIKSATDFTGRPTVAGSIKAVLHEKSGDSQQDTPSREISLSKSAKRIAASQKQMPGPTLFIGNLSFESNADDIRGLIEFNDRERIKWVKKEKQQPKKRKKDAEADASTDPESSSSESEDDGPVAVAKAGKEAGAGIRQVRLGTFEDSGKCKGWAFVDFHTPKQATLALLNARNHRLNGRDLKVEYASADAVRRGGNALTPEQSAQLKSQPKKNTKGQLFGNAKRKRDPEPSSKVATPAAAVEQPVRPMPTLLTAEELARPVEKQHKPTKEEREAARRAKRQRTA